MNFFNPVLLTLLGSSAFAGGFTFIPHRNLVDQSIEHITAELSINNQSQYCLVDTGASYSIAKVSILKDLEKVGEIPGGGLSNPNLLTDLVKTDLQLGAWTLTNTVVGRSDRIPFPCLIGNDFFLGKSFSINFKEKTFTEIDALQSESLTLDVYKHDFGGHFGFAVTVADQSTKSIFDTGASNTVIDLSLVTSQPESFTFIKDLSATDGNNVLIKAALYRLKRFKFANVELNDIEVIAIDLTNLKDKIPGINVVLGMDIIQNYSWSFDTKSQLWSFQKN